MDCSLYSQNELPAWQLELIQKYPLIYSERDEKNSGYYMKKGDKTFDADDYCNLRHGFEFGEGWAKLADEFSSIANDLVVHLRATTQPDAFIHAGIFKEKFGELRWQGRDNLAQPFKTLFWSAVDRLQKISSETCEITGKHGKLREINGWLHTLCDEEYIRICEENKV